MLEPALDRIFREYMDARAGGDEAFAGHPLAGFIRGEARDEVLAIARAAATNPGAMIGKGSAGDRNRWTHTPWIAVMDRRETESVREGVYVVYLFSTDCQDLYLTINQGCTRLYLSATRDKEETARAELLRRAQIMRGRLPSLRRLSVGKIDLKETGWRSRLYEAGVVASIRYRAGELPSEDILADDLAEAMRVYDILISEGGGASDDDMLADAEDEAGRAATLLEAKRYRQHRRIERAAGTSKKVKDVLGFRCMGCDVTLGNIYGPIAEGYIEAHHLRPLHSYADGVLVTLDPSRDFAVLCANCHRVIHRMEDASDIAGLRALVAAKRPAG